MIGTPPEYSAFSLSANLEVRLSLWVPFTLFIASLYMLFKRKGPKVSTPWRVMTDAL